MRLCVGAATGLVMSHYIGDPRNKDGKKMTESKRCHHRGHSEEAPRKQEAVLSFYKLGRQPLEALRDIDQMAIGALN